MAKTNYTKVEEALILGLRKMQVAELLDLADRAAEIGTGKKESDSMERRRLGARALGHALGSLAKKDKKIFEKISISKKEAGDLSKLKGDVSDQDWKKIQSLREQIHEIRVEISDEDLIEEQRERHLTKRFNVSEKWLPLD